MLLPTHLMYIYTYPHSSVKFIWLNCEVPGCVLCCLNHKIISFETITRHLGLSHQRKSPNFQDNAFLMQFLKGILIWISKTNNFWLGGWNRLYLQMWVTNSSFHFNDLNGNTRNSNIQFKSNQVCKVRKIILSLYCSSFLFKLL